MENNIKDIKLTKLENANFIKTSLCLYNQNGVDKSWEIVKAHDSVAILIYHKDKKAFVLVKQFRVAVYLNNNDGITTELCAGIVDKDCSLEQIAQEEVLEECGYGVEIENIEKVTSFHSSVGFAGSRQNLYYVKVDDSMKISEGGGIEDEVIEVFYLPIKDAMKFVYQEDISKTSGLMFAFMWWFDKKSNNKL